MRVGFHRRSCSRIHLAGFIYLIIGLAAVGCVGIPSGGGLDNLNSVMPVTATYTQVNLDPNDGVPKLTLQSTVIPTRPVIDPDLSTNTPVSIPTAPPLSTPTLDPEGWRSRPVLPAINPRALRILTEGISQGNNPRAFSKIGDCESRTTWFLNDFDLDTRYYALGPYEEALAPVIAYYQGSFNRLSQAAKPGFTAASLLSPIWADRQACEKGESPLECEYRLNRPVMAFIMIGTNDAVNPKTFEGHMRKVIEVSLEHNVLPVLGTKADNIEGDHAINAIIAQLAYEYDLPLWNFWLAVQDLPGHGLQPDGAHLTFAAPFFDNSSTLKNAWPVRNLNALQILSTVMVATHQ